MLGLLKIQQGETAGKDLDAALKPVAADKDHRLETDDEVAPTTALDDAGSSVRGNDTAPEPAHRDDFIEGPVLRNIKSHAVHKCSTVDGRTLCSRLTSAGTFEFLAEGCSTLNARCCRCFKGQVLSTPAAMAEALDAAKAKRVKRT